MTSPGLRFGRYEVGERLGKGGFGVVHLARDVELGRDIAIKFLKPEYLMRPQIVQRFLQEARAAAKIGHAGIVTVFECGHVDGTGLRVDGTAFIAMELLRGENLADRLLNGGRLSAGKAIAVARQLADALGAAHAASIIHRDLKPDNVFLVPDAAIVGGERVKILDFGVAKLAEPADQGVHTHSQLLLGTPRYMSPEQSRSAAKIDTRSDVYALGCILFELVTGRTPFDGDSGELIAKHQRDPVPDLRALAPVPDAYAALVEAMLAKSPDARPQTMGHVSAALATMDGSHAPPPPAPIAKPAEAETTIVHASTLVRRRRFAWIGAGVLAIGIVALVVDRGGHGDKPMPHRDAAIATAPPAAVAPDVTRAPAPTEPEANPTREITVRCMEAKAARDWTKLHLCGAELAPLQPSTARTLLEVAARETAAEDSFERLRKTTDRTAALAVLAEIPEDSVYRAEAERLVPEDRATRGGGVAPRPETAPAACNVAALKAAGDTDYSNGSYAAATRAFESAYACSGNDSMLLARAYQSACKGQLFSDARALFHQLPANQQANPQLLQICMAFRFDPRQ